MSHPLISFVIVTYNSADTIEACLTSIERHTMVPFEAVVVDNSPDEETAMAVARFLEFRDGVTFRLDKTDNNLGFAKGCNRGAREVTGDYIFFLNPDTELLNDAGAEMLRCMKEHPLALAVGPAIFGRDGTVTATCRNLPTVGRIVLDATGIDRWVGAYRMTHFSHREPRRVEQIIGAAMLISRDAYWRAEGLDERFFIYYEEVDLCKRLLEAGGEVWFWPAAEVRHLAGASTDAPSVRAGMIYILRESRKKYFRKHFGVRGELMIDIIDRMEGAAKWAVLNIMGMLRGRASDREKARGFLAVALGSAPRN
jgi:N-acetylglucosaminyl-diphospho-decaprenol L-rhamnosyltransferase